MDKDKSKGVVKREKPYALKKIENDIDRRIAEGWNFADAIVFLERN
jgi:hypothetical protein